MFNLFRRKRSATPQKTLTLNFSNDLHSIQFQFQLDGQPLSLPISAEQFRDITKANNAQLYFAYEFLLDEGFIYDYDRLSIADLYAMQQDEDYVVALQDLCLHKQAEHVTGVLKIQGTPAKDPSFDLQLYENGKNVKQIARVHEPFFTKGDERYVLPKPIYELLVAMNKTYDSGYEKTAIVQQRAIEAGVELDSFLQKETYHIVDEYTIEPTMLDDTTLQLSVVGKDEAETAHLRSLQNKSSFKQDWLRERYVTPEAIREDVAQIQRKSVFRGAEIPMLLENPEAFFPELSQPFNLADFSDRVIGFVKLSRPTPVMKDGKRTWFDKESGHELSLNEHTLRDDILKNPDEPFIYHEGSWVFVDKKLKEKLGIIDPDAETDAKARYALEIKGNEQELTYDVTTDVQTTVHEYSLPTNIKATLFPHQIEGYNWLMSLYEQRLNGLLADDMGLGKTLQVITFMQKLYEDGKLFPSLVVLPIALIDNWVNEIRIFAPELSNSIYIHQGSRRLKQVAQLKEKQLIFTSYDTLKIDQLLIGQLQFECIVLDEAQNIKSNNTGRSRAIRAMQSNFRLAMTGTPVENTLEELWTIMDFVEPGALGALAHFKEQYIKHEDYDGLKQRLQKYYLRRTKDEVLKEHLPQKHLLDPTFVQASSMQVELSKSMLQSVQAKTSNSLTIINHLRALYAHTNALSGFEAVQDTPEKFEAVMTLLQHIHTKNEKVLIFTDLKKVQQLLKHRISQQFGISVPIINGETPNRPEAVRQFNEQAGFGVMILSPRAAGVGLTITSANHVVHYTRWWNPAVENQATDRAYRIGQTKDVYVYQIITQDAANFPNGTVEEVMHQLLQDKSYLAENVIVPFDTKNLQQQVLHHLNASSPVR
ncbi:DEAD/DEAH box helicase [Caryophanon latum]|uniref:Helicase n=1 Tax=Caryophanon latum TaxID=33977 RepID=A0A1C0YJC9_9BACL|nr:DEAD/DEAH box helicase [Caryophanon latum]OCS87278.1 hypothetical protein A6K76_02605 [Caryophanon latum]